MTIIAEAGTGHNGDIKQAHELIDAAAQAGAHYIKFQYVIAREILHPLTKPLVLFDKKVDLFQRFIDLEQTKEFYADLIQYARKKNIGFLCSAFGLESAANLLDLGVDSIKIASPELNHVPLMDFLNHNRISVFASNGLAKLGDIEKALALLTNCSVVLFHCVTSYPAEEKDYALACLPHLQAIFSVDIGCSDHTKNPLFIPLLAQYYGAQYLEKHITLTRQGPGLDDELAITPQELADLCKETQSFDQLLHLEGANKAYKHLIQRFSEDRVMLASGSGQYTLSQSEETAYHTSRRSIIALENIAAGESCTKKNCAVLRAEQGGVPGLHPKYFTLIQNKSTKRDVPAGRGVQWGDLLL